jgi:hypothetical protein
MSLPTVTLNEDSPAGTAYIRGGDDRIREYKLQVREILAIDHFFPSSGQDDACGRHKQMTLIEATNIGTGVVGGVGVPAITVLGGQTVSGKSELVYTDEDNTDVIITDVGKIALQNSRLPNNTYLIARNQAGAANVNMFKVNASDIIEFATFPITPSAAPDADYEVANKKYIDDKFPVNLASGVTGTLDDANGGTGYTLVNIGTIVAGDGEYTITFATAFSSATSYNIVVCYRGAALTTGNLLVRTKAAATCTIYGDNCGGANAGYAEYIAIGNR